MRVVAGELRGRRLATPRGERTRPTAERVREAIFSMLGPVTDARVLDLYAGTGALGIEALSRGAARATFVESRRAAAVCLRENLRELALDARSDVLEMRAERSLAMLGGSGDLDLVLCDPPWANVNEALGILSRFVEAGGLADGARVVLVHRRGHALPLEGTALTLTDDRAWGDSAAAFLSARHEEAAPGGDE